MTHFEFRWSGAEVPPAGRRRIERLLQERLGHLGSRVTSVRVFVGPAAEPDGSRELRIVLRLARAADLVIAGRHHSLRALATETAQRANRAVLRSLERRRDRRRRARRTSDHTTAA
jgi:hypothetical protein